MRGTIDYMSYVGHSIPRDPLQCCLITLENGTSATLRNVRGDVSGARMQALTPKTCMRTRPHVQKVSTTRARTSAQLRLACTRMP